MLLDAKTIYPGNAFARDLRDPLVGLFQAIGEKANLKLNVINLHMKAFPDSSEKRNQQFKQLAQWLNTNTLDDDVIICGDTNIYLNETDTDNELINIGYSALTDPELTAIPDGSLSQRFDRFYTSDGLQTEIDSAKNEVGEEALVDSLQEQ